jgi:hypothetical protein
MHPRIALPAKLATISLFTALAAAAAQGCGPDKPADAPTGTSGASTAPASSAAPSATTASTATSATGPALDPAAKARMDAVKGSPLAVPVASTNKDDMLERGLIDTAAWFSKGLSADGPYYKATLAERGIAHVDLTLKAGKCYVLVGFAKLGTIVDYDLAIFKTTGEKVAEDDDDDASPTIGKPPMCPTEDTTYIVEIKSDKGAGDAVVQLFSKAK